MWILQAVSGSCCRWQAAAAVSEDQDSPWVKDVTKSPTRKQ